MSTLHEAACPSAAESPLGEALAQVLEGLKAGDGLSDNALRLVLTHAVRCYVSRLRAGKYFDPFDPAAEISATEAMIISTEVLKSADLQLFELGMWQAMGSPS